MSTRSAALLLLGLTTFAAVLLDGCGGATSDGAPTALPTPTTLSAAGTVVESSGGNVSSAGATPIKPALLPLLEPADAPRVMDPGNLRMSVVYECWYALRQSWLGRRDPEGPHDPPSDRYGHTQSNWDYLSNDMNAYNYVNSYYRQYPTRGTGRGGQCPFFAALAIRRGTGRTPPFFWNGCPNRDSGPAVNALPGDVIWKESSPHHVAVAVKRLNASQMDVVDSNHCTREVIERHPIDLAGWRYLSGRGRWY